MSEPELRSPYRLLRLLGEGAMGQVHLAEHLSLGRKEALKVLNPRLAQDEYFVASLRREARTTNRLAHPNIVSVYGFGRLDDGRYFLAMEYLEGVTLEQHLATHGPLSDQPCLRLLLQVGQAMKHAHEHEVVHRDLKPANIMLTPSGKADPLVKVLDFGFAKIIDPGDDIESGSSMGARHGTPAYMAPEKLMGESNEPNTDIYSLGCMAYAMLTGHPPFEGPPLQVLHAHQSETPEPLSKLGTVSPALEALVNRCLEKAPSSRFQNGGEFVRALLDIPGFQARPRGKSRTTAPRDAVGTVKTHPNLQMQMGPSTLVDLRDEEGTAHTLDLSSTLAVHEFQASLFDLAETLISIGCRDVQLIMAVAAIFESRDELASIDEELDEKSRHADRLAMRFRQREAVLSFALGDINFDVQRDSAPEALSEAARQARKLTDTLKKAEDEFQRDMAAVNDQEIALATRRAGLEEELERQYAELFQIVDASLPEFEEHKGIPERCLRLREALAELPSMP